MGTPVLTMLMITCQISVLVALCLSSPTLKSILRDGQTVEDSWPAQDFYSRFVVKRDNFIANPEEYSSDQRCIIHRYTLMELHQMMEDEVRVFKECLTGANDPQK